MKTIKIEISKKLADTILTVTTIIAAVIVVQYIEFKNSEEMQDIQYRLEVLEQTKSNLKIIDNE